jgi:hypothetical protein
MSRRTTQRKVARAVKAGSAGNLTGLKKTVRTATFKAQEEQQGRQASPTRRVSINPNQAKEDLSAIRRRSADQRYMPKSYSEKYLDQEAGALQDAANGGYYYNPLLKTSPDLNAMREANESSLFAQSQRPTEDNTFIPLTYAPTKTSWPANGWDHRRTVAAGYDRQRGLLRIEFYTDGSIYDYGTTRKVPSVVAEQFRLTQSPGRFINSTLESYGYTRIL